MRITATKLRQNLYHILDEILLKGIPVEIERKGEILKIIAEKPRSKLENLEEHNTIIGEAEDLIHIDLNSEWNEEKNL